ncbi:phytanoyl-CoA dioxygenase family protein [Paenibacillus rhizovicinus]|uniref:Phytanoyl-CoA dioxygenase family protein n=1 Tax=Paenibacillus rhizovicinus TaxID=2704463 RepID=A0A6C0P7M8_9BACL|nr:phytanoyl-CoA dioxygenase family protein [Paenibacillus rhizovicinus]QHW34459.1 phytanoyl-CoA dioxygenase family protein [Paenibacillus rhizovicinus]
MGYVITREQTDFFRNEGYIQLDDVLTEAQIEELSDYLNEVMQAKSDGGDNPELDRVLKMRMNTWKESAGMAKYSLSPRLAELAMQLAGLSGVRLFHDQAFWKMPGDSKPTPWHQDATYFPMKESEVMTMWIPLDDVDENNGCLSFVPRSHQAGKLDNVDFVNPVDLFDLAKSTSAAGTEPVTVPLKRGSCTVHHGLTFHYAYANKTDKPRRVLTIVYMPEHATFDGGSNHFLMRGMDFEDGDAIVGDMFPVLARRS